MAQVPPPPQADGKKTLSVAKADNSEDPGLTVKIFSPPLTEILTSPWGTSFFLAVINPAESKRITIEKTTIETSIDNTNIDQ